MTTKKNSKKTKTEKKFNFLDYFCIITSIVISVIIIFFYHENPPLYTFASIVALIGGVVSTILGIKGYKSSYIVSFIMAFACGYTAQANHFLGNAIINIFFYAPFTLLGFYSWSKHQGKNKKVVARKFTPKQIILAIIIFIISTIALNLNIAFFGGEQAILDSSATILIVFATVLSVFRYRETWLCWLLADILQLIMWTATNDPAVLALRIFYPLSAVYGFINWKTLLKPSKK